MNEEKIEKLRQELLIMKSLRIKPNNFILKYHKLDYKFTWGCKIFPK